MPLCYLSASIFLTPRPFFQHFLKFFATNRQKFLSLGWEQAAPGTATRLNAAGGRMKMPE